jgi:hypothetical protein
MKLMLALTLALSAAAEGATLSAPSMGMHAPKEDAQVTHFLASIDLAEYAAAFAEHEVDYETLMELNDSQLKEIGVFAVGARLKIRRASTLRQSSNIKNDPRVAKFLGSAGLSRHMQVFAAHGITCDVLPVLTDADLATMGMYLGDRRAFQKRINESYTWLGWEQPGQGHSPGWTDQTQFHEQISDDRKNQLPEPIFQDVSGDGLPDLIISQWDSNGAPYPLTGGVQIRVNMNLGFNVSVC